MRNAFRYLKITAILALILNFGIFLNRLNILDGDFVAAKKFSFSKQARDIWIVLGQFEDWDLRLSPISRGDTSNPLHSVSIHTIRAFKSF